MNSQKPFKLATDGLGLIVPMNVEALCVNNDEVEYVPAPYNFSRLPNADDPSIPNLSNVVMTSGLVNMQIGVHLHWALPDGLTKGVSPQSSDSSLQFPQTPDRWLINRVFTDISDPNNPVNTVKSWVIESNYVSVEKPERETTTVPFKTDDDSAPQYRYLGRVQEFETWREQFLAREANPELKAADTDNYVPGLSAVGYGSPEFAASYANCKSVFGFYDQHKDLQNLGVDGADYLLSYQVIGWYHDVINDPVTQLPIEMAPEPFDRLLDKITVPADKDTIRKYYTRNTTDNPYVLRPDLDSPTRLILIRIFTEADYGFLTDTLNRNAWSLPSGTKLEGLQVTHTLITGTVGPVLWNTTREYPQMQDETISIAIGNTASEALSALIADLTGNQELPFVESILNALQLGLLKDIGEPDHINRYEQLQLDMHASSYANLDGGGLWQVSLIPENDKDQGSDEVNLPPDLADEINNLNLIQSDLDRTEAEIATQRSEIFMDWYRFMQVLRRGPLDPDHNMQPRDMAEFIQDEIESMQQLIQKNETERRPDIAERVAWIISNLPQEYQLEMVQGPRYYEPEEPVALFQGASIKPPQRYGGDGRYMANQTLLCRLSTQVITTLTIPGNQIGNPAVIVLNRDNTPQLPGDLPLDYGNQVHSLFTENSLLNPTVVAALCINNGSTLEYSALREIFLTNLREFLSPSIPEMIPNAEVELIGNRVAEADFKFFKELYIPDGPDYVLKVPLSSLEDDKINRLKYIFISASMAWGVKLPYTGGIAPSEIYFVKWDENPWLPFSFSWEISFAPFAAIESTQAFSASYDPEFIIKTFKLGDVGFVYKGDVPILQETQAHSNTSFMTPHAEQNFQEQIKKFIDAQKDSPFDKELKAILESMKDFPPILSQSFNGFNSDMIMRNEVLQLDIKDPVHSMFSGFTEEVRQEVGPMTQTSPSMGSYYNPIRTGLMRIDKLTIIDAFGRKVTIDKPRKIIVAQGLITEGLPANYVYLPPRILQPARLQFRWLAAKNNAIEMNTHPATTPICGWLLANHLDNSLVLYTNAGAALGSLTVSENLMNVIWQGVPGGPGFGLNLYDYFESGPGKDVNASFKKLVISLFNDGQASYLQAFLRANDLTFSLVQPENFKQLGSNAVLMGSPIAVAQARLDMETAGMPAYNQSWEAMEREVNDSQPKTDNGFTKVKFPIRLGSMEQVNDGLLGYFKNNDYSHYYALHTDQPSDQVTIPDETNILLSLERPSNSELVTLLFDPRGSIHATSGVFPVKEINIPPDVFADALETLRLTFLTTPILTNSAKLAFPVPAQDGGQWTWLENDLDKWSEASEIAGIDDKATMDYTTQEIKEGWLVLTKGTQK